MAKKKKGGKRRSRSVGAFSLSKKGTGMKLLALAGGYLLADSINGMVDKVLPGTTDATTGIKTVSPSMITVAGVGQLGIGGMLLMSKQQSTLKTVAGGIMAGAGAKRMLVKAGIIKGYRVNGYQSVPVIGKRRVNGYQKVPVMGSTPAQLAGTPAQLQGYTSQGSGVLAGFGCVDNGSGITQSSVSGYMG